jgi:uncharacterized protein YgbK (DUF1537 family)
LLASQTTRPLALISLAVVQAGVAALAERLRIARGQGAQLFVVDAMSDADLETLLAAQQQALPGALLCGSAGLIEPLARSLAPEKDRATRATVPPRLHAPGLIVVGSGSPMAHRQVDALRTHSDIQVCEVADPTRINTGGGLAAMRWRGLLLHQPKPEAGALLEGPEARARSLQFTRAAAAMARSLAVWTIIVVGGDTTAHLLDHLGIQRLTVLAELMPGIPLLEGIDATDQYWQLVSKAGNFGDERTLVQLVRLLTP